MTFVCQLSYTSDSPPPTFLFVIKGKRFTDVVEMAKKMTEALVGITEDEFKKKKILVTN